MTTNKIYETIANVTESHQLDIHKDVIIYKLFKQCLDTCMREDLLTHNIINHDEMLMIDDIVDQLYKAGITQIL